MKKDLIFAPILVVIGVFLCLRDLVGMPAHIAVSVLGVLVLAVYTGLTKKEWRIPALEIAMRAFYGVALITGIVVMNVKDVAFLAILHKVSAIIFLVLVVGVLVSKLLASKESK